MHLTDFKVRVLDTAAGTGAVTRVLIDSTDGERTWSTIGVCENIIEASWQALSDSIVYGLLHTRGLRPSPMAAPEYVPVPPSARPRSYESPDHVPEAVGGRPPGRARAGRSPSAPASATRAPTRATPSSWPTSSSSPGCSSPTGSTRTTPSPGCVGIALRRASMFGRAPAIHDLTIAFTIWGFLDPSPPAELVELRRRVFAGVGHVTHHYAEGRAIVDAVPEATLRMTPAQVRDAYPARWHDLIVK